MYQQVPQQKRILLSGPSGANHSLNRSIIKTSTYSLNSNLNSGLEISSQKKQENV